MKSFYISLDSMEKVHSFINDINMIEGDAFLAGYCYVIDAKSVIGVFSRNLAEPLKLEIIDWNEDYQTLLQKYMITES